MSVRTNQNDRLMVDFACYAPDGRKLRCRESTGLLDTESNRKIAIAKDRAVQYELSQGTFDYLHFFPNGAKAHLFKWVGKVPTLGEWWDAWLREKSLRWTTAKGWNSSYRVHIEPYFSHMPIDHITDHEILIFRKKLENKGLKASTINDKLIKPLCMCLYRAYNLDLIPSYPCQSIRRLTEELVDIQPFTYGELSRFLEVLKERAPWYYDMFFIWSRTGLRPGEIFALKWEHVDYFNGRLMIRKTRSPLGVDGPPKTRSSSRDIGLRNETIQAFQRQQTRTGLKGGSNEPPEPTTGKDVEKTGDTGDILRPSSGYVFTTEAGSPFSDAFMRKKFRYLLRLAGLSYRPPKQMRHTFATLALAAGENPDWVSKTLGHASPETTWKRYNRFIPNLTRRDGSALEKYLAEASG